MRIFICLAFLCATATSLYSQTLNDIDTTHGFGRELYKLYQRFDAIRFSGYICPTIFLPAGCNIASDYQHISSKHDCRVRSA